MTRSLQFRTVVIGWLAWSLPWTAGALVIEAEEASVRTIGAEATPGIWNLWSAGEVGDYVHIEAAGEYVLKVRAYGSPAEGQWPRMRVSVDGEARGETTVESARARDYTFQIALEPGVFRLAVSFLNDARTDSEDRNLYLDRIEITAQRRHATVSRGDAERWQASRRAREDAAEAMTLAKAAESTEQHRKRDATVVVRNGARPVPDAEVSVEQVDHAFLFGCNIFSFDRLKKAHHVRDYESSRLPDMSLAEEYKARFEALFNYATLPFYWRWYEEERGRPNYAYTETVIEWCKERGIRMKAHPVLWDAISGKPAWNGDRMPPPELQRARIFDLLGRFGDAIEFWEIVNEPAHCKGVAIDEPYRWARQARPDACLIVNDYQVMADGCPPFYELLKAAVRAGVPFDGIGIQAHEPPHLWFPMDRTWEILDRYAELGKGLHITEFTPTSDGERVVGMVDRGVWDEEKQAEFAEKFYRVCFGHPAVVAITWWDLSDATSWRKNGGLVDAEMRPKPAYLRLRRLIREEWMTRISGRTDETGRFAFRGFFGRYRVTVMSGSAAATREVNLEKGDSRGARVEWVVDLPAQQPERNGTASLERARHPTVKTAPR